MYTLTVARLTLNFLLRFVRRECSSFTGANRIDRKMSTRQLIKKKWMPIVSKGKRACMSNAE